MPPFVEEHQGSSWFPATARHEKRRGISKSQMMVPFCTAAAALLNYCCISTTTSMCLLSCRSYCTHSIAQTCLITKADGNFWGPPLTRNRPLCLVAGSDRLSHGDECVHVVSAELLARDMSTHRTNLHIALLVSCFVVYLRSVLLHMRHSQQRPRKAKYSSSSPSLVPTMQPLAPTYYVSSMSHPSQCLIPHHSRIQPLVNPL
ncbi:hypothetical protein B0T10DRAFT_216733 [Thelonectria olida]|uniref:Uncharacterized protein n=1 Tax=Thelonectria olida TaxID=1576542 RepID=A0A9P8WC62_9HYPO|nr:hypothetical protein B0T10DRAFT_216733 [Thelonectria olida]